jgi:hypothetical protein
MASLVVSVAPGACPGHAFQSPLADVRSPSGNAPCFAVTRAFSLWPPLRIDGLIAPVSRHPVSVDALMSNLYPSDQDILSLSESSPSHPVPRSRHRVVKW